MVSSLNGISTEVESFSRGGSAALELGLQQVHRDVRAREQLARRLLAFLQQAEEDVLGPDDLAPLLARLVARQEEDPLGLLGELLEHRHPRRPPAPPGA